MRWRKMVLFVPMVFVLRLTVIAQGADAEIASQVKMIEEGRVEQVKLGLPALIAKYQNDPGILYLQGRLAKNGIEAAKFYQSVLDNYPKSGWADDALYRIYLYYYSLGLSRTAELKMQQLRKEYPNSSYIKEKLAVDTSEGEERAPLIMNPTPPQSVDTTPPRPIHVRETGSEGGASSGAYAIQVGAFSSVENATKLRSFLEELGYPVEVQNKVRGGRSLYLVWVGSFATADEARRFGAEIKAKHNVESIVVTR